MTSVNLYYILVKNRQSYLQMKRFTTSIDFKFWTPTLRIGTTFVRPFVCGVLLASFFVPSIHAKQFSENEKVIINDAIKKFKRECVHIGSVDETKLKEIHSLYQAQRDSMSRDVVNCYGEYLSQLAGTHSIYRQSCDEITQKKDITSDRDLSRLFINVRKFKDGIRGYHEKLNDCLIRRGAPSKHRVSFSDYELNGRVLSGKIRQIDVSIPFKENSVSYR